MEVVIYAADFSADSSHVNVSRCTRFVASHTLANKREPPIVYRLCSRPIAGTMEIIERTNYDSEKYRETEREREREREGRRAARNLAIRYLPAGHWR